MDARALNTIFAQSHPESQFVSSGGNTELDQRSTIAIAILSKVFPTVEILVLKDRDMASGKRADEHDRVIYLENNPKNHRVLKRFELENYLYDKEVLNAYCADKNLPFQESAYDSVVTDIYNQDLKEETGRIKKICGIRVSISSDDFKIALASYLTDNMSAFIELQACIFSLA